MNNYIEFKSFLKSINNKTNKPTLLLHSCCGPCSSAVLERLLPFFDITIYYYNPNIYPHYEFIKRSLVQQDIINKLDPNIKLLIVDEPHEVYLKNIGDSCNLPEGSMRCYKCYDFRIKRLSEYASINGFDYYTTVMSVSPYKNSAWINELGLKYQDKSIFLYSDFKKENGYQRSIEMSKEYGLYRQDYCGCEFSIKEHEERILCKTNNNLKK